MKFQQQCRLNDKMRFSAGISTSRYCLNKPEAFAIILFFPAHAPIIFPDFPQPPSKDRHFLR
ncbi:ATP-dependent RNA helicase HrpA, partial [Neisseria meningitidis]